jgi:hypothetical protein
MEQIIKYQFKNQMKNKILKASVLIQFLMINRFSHKSIKKQLLNLCKMLYKVIMELFLLMDKLVVVKHTQWLENLMWRNKEELFQGHLTIFLEL